MDSVADIGWFLVETNIKVLVVLLLLQALLAAFRYVSSAIRLNLMTAGLFALVLLPVLVATLPGIPVPVYLEMKPVGQNGITTGSDVSFSIPPEISASEVTAIPSSFVTDLTASAPKQGGSPWVGILLILWGGVAAVLLARLAWGSAKLHGIVRRASSLTHGELVEQMYELKRELGIRRLVEIRMTEEDITPLTVGAFKPVILVPEQIHAWPAEVRRTVLIHELIHIKRFDYPLHLLVNIAQAFYWINPFALRWAERFQAEQEVSCDDLVIRSGVRPKAYARQMLSVALSVASPQYCTPFWSGAGGRQEFERRMMSALNAGKNRKPSSPRSRVWTFISCLLLMVPLAALKFTEISPSESESMFFSQGCWAKIEDGRRLIISDDCRLMIDEVAYIQEGWKDKRLEFPRGSSFHAGDLELTGGYLAGDIADVLVTDKSAGTVWTLSFAAESRQVVLARAGGGGLECVNSALVPDSEIEISPVGMRDIETFVKVNIRDREQILSNRMGLAFLVLAKRDKAPEIHAGAGGVR